MKVKQIIMFQCLLFFFFFFSFENDRASDYKKQNCIAKLCILLSHITNLYGNITSGQLKFIGKNCNFN